MELRNIGDIVGKLPGAPFCRVAAIHQDFAAYGRGQTQYCLEKRGFSNPVRTQKTADFAGIDDTVHIFQNYFVSVAGSYITKFQFYVIHPVREIHTMFIASIG